MIKQTLLASIFILFLGLFVLTGFYYTQKNTYLTFSDATRFADTARQILEKGSFTTKFAFYDPQFIDNVKNKGSSESVAQPIFSAWIALFFLIFGISDFTVFLSSAVPFLFTGLLLFLIGKRFGQTSAGFFAAIALLCTAQFLDYASTGASEPLGVFFLGLAFYLLTFKSTTSSFIAGIITVLMVFTRPQSLLFIPWLVLVSAMYQRLKPYLIGFFISTVMCWFIFGTHTFTHYLLGVAPLLSERLSKNFNSTLTGVTVTFSFKEILIKTFYNFYNFTSKLLPHILNPVLALFSISIFFKPSSKNKIISLSYLATTLLLFIATSAALPHLRYLHLGLPFLYLLSFIQIEHLTKTKLISSLIVIVFFVYPILGLIFLDSRSKQTNFFTPPAHVELAKFLKNNSKEDWVILTNLDGWGTWYSDRFTMWNSANVSILENDSLLPDAIFLTNYNIEDKDASLDSSWLSVLNNEPSMPQYIKSNYKFEKRVLINDKVYGSLWFLNTNR